MKIGSLAARRAQEVAAFAILGGAAAGQTVLRSWPRPGVPECGQRSSGAGDLDRDGFSDVFVNELPADAAGHYHGVVYSAVTGATLLDLDLGTLTTVAFDLSDFTDVDGDSIPDLLVGAGGLDSVTAYSGASGAVIWQTAGSGGRYSSFGFSIDPTGDLDGDGCLDVAVGDPYTATGGSAHVLSGRTGAELFKFTGFDAYAAGGFVVRGAGDLNGDGTPDWLAAAPFSSPSNTGAVHVLSGIDGSEIDRIDGDGPDYKFGKSLDVGPDCDGDGVDDLIVRSTWTDPYSEYDYVDIISGKTRSSLKQWRADPRFGDPVGATGDLDGDGLGDFLVSTQGDAKVYVYSGATFGLIATIPMELTFTAHDPWDISAVAAGDADGDGISDLLLWERNKTDALLRMWSISSAPLAEGVAPDRGRFDVSARVTVTGQNFTKGSNVAVLVGGVPATGIQVLDDATLTCDTPVLPGPGREAVTVSHSLGGRSYGAEFRATPVVIHSGEPELGSTVTLHFLVEVGDDVLGILGLGPPASIPTPPFVGELQIQPFTILFLVPHGSVDTIDVDLDIPNDPALLGLEGLFQALSGPVLIGTPKHGAWSDLESLEIR